MTTAAPPTLSPARVRLALFALAIGGFGIGCTEFVVLGLLPNVARDLLPQLSTEHANAQAGLLATVYALGVVVGAPTIAAFAARFPRKKLLVVLAAAFTFFTILSAVLPTFELVLGARFLAGLPHGAYFGIAALVAAELMGPGKRAAGVAFVLMGLTTANVVGVPLITFLGQATNWRIAYLAVAAVFAATLVLLMAFLPVQPGDPHATMRRELSALGRSQVWLTLALGSVGFGGFFAVYTYVAPLATDVAMLPTFVIPIVLVVFGLGMTIGNLAGGWLADRGTVRSMYVFFGVFVVGLVELILAAGSSIGLFIGVFVVGLAAAGLSPSIQTRLMDVAGDSQTLAAAANHSALNIGNSIGASLGGIVIAAGLGYVAPVWAGLALCVPGIIILTVSVFVQHRRGGTIDGSHRAPTVPLNAS